MPITPDSLTKTIKSAPQEKKTAKKDILEKEEEKKEEEKKAVSILKEEELYAKGLIKLRDLIAPSALRVTPYYLQLGDQYLRTIFVVGFPRYISVGWFSPIIHFNASMDVAMFFYPVKSEIILKQLQKRVGNIEVEITAAEEKSMPRDPLKETALRDIEKLRDDLTTGVEHFFQFGLYVTIYASSEKDLNQLTDQIESIFGSKLVYTKRVLYQTEQGFNSTLPFGIDDLMVLSNLNTSPCASSFPFISADVTSDNGILYGINRHNNSLILFDRFKMPNANMTIFATSGSGKSYFVKLEILRSLMQGTDVIVIDPEREYKYLSDAVAGTYIDISLNSESKLNPFDLPLTESKDVKVADLVRSAIINLKGLLKIMVGLPDEKGINRFTPAEDSLLDRALLETYAKKDIVPGCDLKKVEMPVMSDLVEVLEGMERGEDLAERLKKYTEGTFAGLLNQPTNVEFTNQLVVFSVRDLEDELRPTAIYTIINYIWTVVRSKIKKRILIIDEAWWLMQHEDSAKFIFSLVKRCRKYYLGISTITQDVNDFLLSPYGNAIVTNSAMQLLMKQSPAAVDLVAKTFHLTEGEKMLLLESGIGEGIFFAGQNRAAIRVVASYSEDQLITSDPRQLLEIEEEKRAFAESLEEEEEEEEE
ncbi:MAG: AAA-like domain protein [Parcubacteria group bacterium ADurb.Bin159]|jgi:type IV secretory pathway VirB4 component|nr:MAG: AAA-like domain protein [Parcubacteria group bacterium ADurb.Bin159]